MAKILIIGGGISSLSAACYLGKSGHDVEILEKNSTVGGRARQLKRDGFTFDMGPTFYWMPDVFEKFFADFGKKSSDFYDLKRLDPGYRIYFGKEDYLDTSADFQKVEQSFEEREKGSSKFLRRFIADASANYDIAVKDIVYKPGISPLELINTKTITRVGKFLRTISQDVRGNIKNKELTHLLEFPVIFLGAKPSSIPAFYNFMNYADLKLGTWHPMGGMYKVIEALEKIAVDFGAKISTNANVEKIVVENSKAVGVVCDGREIRADVVLSGADYHFTELLLDKKYRQYSEKYWQSKVFAPSALLFYVGFNKKLNNLPHHSLFFDADFDHHISSIYDNPSWVEKPLFYSSFPTITDESLAPKGKEAAIFLIPSAPGLKENPELVEKYFENIITRIEGLTGENIREHIVFKEHYGFSNFVKDYNSYKGNAYGLANILLQTAFLRPGIKSKKVDNLFFTGQLTVPGPGVPPSLISGEIASRLINKTLEK